MASKTKKRVPIRAIFTRDFSNNSTRRSDHASRVSKYQPRPSKRNLSTGHPLAKEFSKNIEHSRSEILDRANSALDSTRQILNARLTNASARSSGFIEEVVEQKEQLTQPLDTQKLQFSLKDGKPAGVALLGDRMEQFRQIVAFTEKELAALWVDRDKVRQEMKDLALEMLGPDAMVMLRDYLSIVESGQEDAEKAKAREDVEAAKQRLTEEIEEMSKGFIDKVEASEKKFDTRVQEQKRGFLSAFGENV